MWFLLYFVSKISHFKIAMDTTTVLRSNRENDGFNHMCRPVDLLSVVGTGISGEGGTLQTVF